MSAVAQDLGPEIEAQSQALGRLRTEVGKVIVGQSYMIDRILMALIADGHILIEGIPGLAKTTAIKTVSDAIHTDFSRIQFTPDLLPADLVGTEIYRPQNHEFHVKKGPLFTNLLLADEINRAPAKVQSALLEAMQERQVTIGEQTFPLPDPFLVLATQNPIEQEGTYPLPEAQVDRFMLKLKVNYPDQVYLDEKVEDYIVEVVFATREPAAYKLEKLANLIEYGASPRATIFLARAAKVQAFLAGRGYVTPQDVKTIGPDVLRHRVLLTYEAEARDLTPDDVIQEIFNTVDVP